MIQRLSFDEQWKELMASWERQLHDDPVAWFVSFRRMERNRNRYWCVRLLNMWEGEMMARGGKKGSGGDVKKAGGWTQFVDIRVGEDDVAALRAAHWTGEDVSNMVARLLGEGYRLSFSYNAQNDTTNASMTGKTEDNPHEGKTLSAFHSSWYDALTLLLWKHFEVAGEDWDSVAVSRGRDLYG